MGNTAVHNPRKVYSQYVDAGAIAILSNNVYKVTYYEIITGASGTLTVPSGATINAGEFAGANCILSEIDGNNKPTYVTPLDGGGNPVTSTLNVGTGAWVKSAPTVSISVALIYSVNIAAINYQNLNNFYIIEDVLLAELNVGTTPITSGTNTRILYNNNGVLGEYSVTGTGTTAVLSTSPTFTTDITTPLIIGGTAVGSVIQYKGTSGNGTSTVAAHEFKVGNNGAVSALRISNNGNVYVGNPSNSPLVGGLAVQGGFNTSPTGAGFELEYTAGTCYTTAYDRTGGSWLPMIIRGSSLTFQSSNTTFLTTTTTGSALTFSGAAVSSGAITPFTFTTPANTAQTLSTNIPNFKVTGSTKQWATGALTTQYFNYFSANTVSFVGASTATLAANFVADYVQGGTNATVTTSAAIYVPTLALTNTTNGIGGYFVAPSGATKNWSLGTSGDVFHENLGSGTATISMQGKVGTLSQAAIYLGVTRGSETSINYAFNWSGALEINSQSDTNGINLSVGTQSRLSISGNGTTGTTSRYIFNASQRTSITANTESHDLIFNARTQTWNGGTVATQRGIYFSSQVYNGANFTNLYNLYVEANTGNGTITNNYAAGFSGNVNIIGTPYVSGVAGVDGTFTTVDGKTVTVTKGIITAIV